MGLRAFGTGNWRWRTGALGAVALVVWLPPLIQQFTTEPGNMAQVLGFFLTHGTHRSWHESLRALSTLFGTFPLQRGPHGANPDAALTWLAAVPTWRRPWYLVYVAATLAGATLALARRRREAAALSVACLASLLAAAWSVHLAAGDLYPYIVAWMTALAVPAWVAVGLALAPSVGSGARRFASRAVPALALASAAAVTAGFAGTPSPMAGAPSLLGRRSWQAVSGPVLSPGVRTVYVVIAANEAMPEAAAIADQAVRHGRHVEVNRPALYFFDPSLSPTVPAQAQVVVCCGKGDPGPPPAGMAFRGQVGGQSIYLSRRRARLAARPA